jgi:hypothetical protein
MLHNRNSLDYEILKVSQALELVGVEVEPKHPVVE